MRSSGEIELAAEKLVREFDESGCAAVVVYGIPGITQMKFATNISRWGQPALDEFSRQLRRLEEKVQRAVNQQR